MGKHKRTGIAAGATVLIVTNFIVKGIGVIYKIPLANILGQDGMGYLSTAYEIYLLILTIFSSGGAVAVSKMIAESYALGRYTEIRKVFRLMALSLIVVGSTGTVIMLLGYKTLASLFNNSPAAYCIMVLSPSLFFLSVSSVVRGFFQGIGNMRPTGVSQAIEALSKLLIGVGFAVLFSKLKFPIEIVSAGGISGTTLSTLIGALVVLLIFISSKKRKKLYELAPENTECRSSKQLLLSFWKIVIPLSLSAVVVNLTGFLDLFLIFDRLASIGLTQEEANAAYGAYKGYAHTLFNLPPSIISSINISIIPAISAAFAVKNFKRARHVLNRSIKIVIIMALPCAVGLMVMAGPIQRMLYPARLGEIKEVTPLLVILGFASFWTSISTLTTALLQSAGKMNLPVISLAVGGAVKLITNYILVGIKTIGIKGAPIGTVMCYMVMTVMNYIWLKRELPFKFLFMRYMIKPLFAGGVMGVFVYYCQLLLTPTIGDRIATFFSIILAAGVYALVLVATKGINEDDITLLPKGAVIVRCLKKMRLLRS